MALSGNRQSRCAQERLYDTRHNNNQTVDPVTGAFIRRLQLYAAREGTLTYKNGDEFTEHAKIDKALGLTSYFPDPFSSSQRGSNENPNSFACQGIPKSHPFSTVNDEVLAMIEDRLNNHPCKRFGSDRLTNPLPNC